MQRPKGKGRKSASGTTHAGFHPDGSGGKLTICGNRAQVLTERFFTDERGSDRGSRYPERSERDLIEIDIRDGRLIDLTDLI